MAHATVQCLHKVCTQPHASTTFTAPAYTNSHIHKPFGDTNPFLAEHLNANMQTTMTQPSTERRNAKYGLRGRRIGEASHPGPADTPPIPAVPTANAAANTVRKRTRQAYVVPDRTYTLMQPLKYPHRNPTCAHCNCELVGREWRVRNTNNCGESWHPRCFATTWPNIPIHLPPDTPDEIKNLVTDIHKSLGQHHVHNNQPANGTPEQPSTRDELPPLHGLSKIPWETLLERTPTARHIPPQCQAMYIQLLQQTCAHILHHTQQADETEATNGWKLLIAIPRMVLSNTNKHRAGRKGQGNSSQTKTIRQRIALIYSAQWEQLLTQTEPDRKRAKTSSTKQHLQTQRDKEDIKHIVQHLVRHSKAAKDRVCTKVDIPLIKSSMQGED